MKTGKSIINRIVLSAIVFLLASVNVFAAESSLSGIDIKQPDGQKYKVLLKLDKQARIKKLFDNEGNLMLILNSTLPSDSMEIVYDNANDLNNVTVQKKGADNTLILLQGKNIENSQIYTKELSTGITKELNTNESFLSSLFIVTDKKILASSVLGMIILFLLMLASRPKDKRYSSYKSDKTVKSKKHTAVNTLRYKNLTQSKYIPSINWKENRNFNSINAYSSIPDDFSVNNNMYEEENIRKAG
ncbi:MAG: hypothetical protein LUH05_01545 [Candidatus Gastranaerophilales bacterium]|nr:hypothetical protein [Candidatus Gastranaerophilales bacterium]